MSDLPPSAQQRQKNSDPIKDEWETPQELWDNLNAIFKFDLDAASSFKNHKTPIYFTKEMDSLEMPWSISESAVWCNPPFSLKKLFVQKAALEAEKGLTIVMILPATVDVGWFHKYVMTSASEIYFFRGRVQYDSPLEEEKHGCTFPSMLIVWRPNSNGIQVKSMSVTGEIYDG